MTEQFSKMTVMTMTCLLAVILGVSVAEAKLCYSECKNDNIVEVRENKYL